MNDLIEEAKKYSELLVDWAEGTKTVYVVQAINIAKTIRALVTKLKATEKELTNKDLVITEIGEHFKTSASQSISYHRKFVKDIISNYQLGVE